MTLAPAELYDLDPLRDARHKAARAARECADWLAWLELGNAAARTLDSYERYAAALLRNWPSIAFDEFDDGHLAHVLTLYPPRSRHIVKAAWNNWFRWGYKTRRIPGNPVDLLPRITYEPSRVYDTFDEAEEDALIALPSPNGELMALLFLAGLRRAEAREMTGKRLDFNRLEVHIIDGAKGGKSRKVPMIDRLAVACFQLVTLEAIDRDDHLWSYRPGGGRRVKRDKPIANTSFDNWWAACLKEAGVRHRNPHMTRHTFATRWRQRGLEMEEIQLLLGHKSIRTTVDTYVHTELSGVADHMRELVGDAQDSIT